MRPQTWVVVLWQAPDEETRERCYVFPGEFHALGSFDVSRENPDDATSAVILRCCVWAASEGEAIGIAREARRLMIEIGLWLPVGAGLPAPGLVLLEAALSGAKQALARADTARRNGARGHQAQRAPLAET